MEIRLQSLQQNLVLARLRTDVQLTNTEAPANDVQGRSTHVNVSKKGNVSAPNTAFMASAATYSNRSCGEAQRGAKLVNCQGGQAAQGGNHGYRTRGYGRLG